MVRFSHNHLNLFFYNKSKCIKYTQKLIIIYSLFSFLLGGTTGKISGYIIDGVSGEPLPGAAIMLNNTSLGVSANVDGYYFILGLSPGEYSITASMIGYGNKKIKNISIMSDRTTNINIFLEIESVQGAMVTVIAERSMIQKDATASAAVISSSDMEMSPIESISGMLSTKSGISAGADGVLHFRGGRANQVLYVIDGIESLNPFTSGQGMEVSTNSVLEISVLTGSFNAEYGKAQSGVVNILTKDGQEKLQLSMSVQAGDIFTDYVIDQDSMLQSYGSVYDLLNTKELELSLSGSIPLLKNANFYMSLRDYYDTGYLYAFDRYTTTNVLKDSVGEITPVNWKDKLNGQAKFTYSPVNSVKLSYSMLFSDYHRQSYSHRRKYIVDGNNKYRDTGYQHIFRLSHQLSPKSFYTIITGLLTNDYSSGSYDDYLDSRQVPGELYYIRDPLAEFYIGGTSNSYTFRDYTSTSIKVNYITQLNSRHDIKLGYDFQKYNMNQSEFSVFVDKRTEEIIDENENGIWDEGESFVDVNQNGVYDLESSNDANDDGVFGNITTAGANLTSTINPKPIEMSAFIQDKYELKNLVINAGIRWDYFHPDHYVANDWTNPSLDNVSDVTPKSQISPRFSMAFLTSTEGKLFFSYGHFFQRVPFNKLYHNPEFDILPGLIKSDVGNASLLPEKTITYEIGYEHAINNIIAIKSKLFFKDIRNLLGQRIYVLPGGSDSYALYVNRDFGEVKGINFTIEKRFIDFFGGSIEYDYQVAKGNESNPTQTRRDYRLNIESEKKVVPLSWDQPHALRLNANFNLPFKVSLSVISRLESGYPYTPKSENEVSSIAGENSGRKISVRNTDINFQKRFVFGGKTLIIAYAKIYNIFDKKNENYVWDSTGRAGYSLGQYGGELSDAYENRPQWYSKPRMIYFGLKIEL
ncbi:MAG: carboxypeptidase-like regulatory domain-containing protein [Candidatus Marinimicrobia bacterium]|nr:carboxypeptidase-like regulatory domain-containing protein [Candidatus Neomarinimicrobiota bacterium]MDP7610084.1 carboxypeptidase-like regulatory domain-containing protein [Candidatus Neomarinimicrobiota bacterium]